MQNEKVDRETLKIIQQQGKKDKWNALKRKAFDK